MKKYSIYVLLAVWTALCGSLIIGCTKDEEPRHVALNVGGKDVTMVYTPSEEVVKIESDRGWEIFQSEGSEEWLTISPMSGTGNGTITFTTTENLLVERKATITVKATSSNTSTILPARSVFEVIQEAMPKTILLYENMGATAVTSASSINKCNRDNIWGRTGDGSHQVVYDASEPGVNTSIRVHFNQNNASSGYSDASGGNFLDFRAVPSYFIINNIKTPANKLILTFGCTPSKADAEFDESQLLVSWSTDGSTWNPVSYFRNGGLTSGWDMAVAQFSIPEGSPYVNLKFESTLENGYRVDDITLMTEGLSTVVYTPQLTTYDATNVDMFSATVSGKYVYPDVSPAIVEQGIAWKKSSDTDYTYTSVAGPVSDVDYQLNLDNLEDNTEYTFVAYVKNAEDEVFMGEEVKTFKTVEYTPPTPVTVHREDFSSIGTAGIAYKNNGWSSYSSSEAVSDGWVSAIENGTDKFLRIAPASTVQAYALMNPLDVQNATNKVLYINSSFNKNGLSASNGTTLKVVASTDFMSIFTSATWTEIADLTRDFSEQEDDWNVTTIDLSTVNDGAYASATSLYVALLYEGSTVEYNIDDILFGEPQTVVYGAAEINGILKAAPSTLEIEIPYKFGNGEVSGVTVTCDDAGLTVTPVETTLVSGNGGFTNSLKFSVTGTPTLTDEVTFTFNYPSGVQSTTTSLSQLIADASGRYLLNLTDVAYEAANDPVFASLIVRTPATESTGVQNYTFLSGLNVARESTRVLTPSGGNANAVGYVAGDPAKGTADAIRLGNLWTNTDLNAPTECAIITLTTPMNVAGTINFECYFRAGGTASVEWKIEYSLDKTTWTLASTGSTHTTNGQNDIQWISSFVLPEGVSVPASGKIYFRISPNVTPVTNGGNFISKYIKIQNTPLP